MSSTGWTLLPWIMLSRLKGKGPVFDKGCLDRAGCLWRENGLRINRTRYRLFPCLNHLIKFLADLRCDEAVSTHKSVVEVVAQNSGIRTSDVLCNRVKHIESRKLPLWRYLVRRDVNPCMNRVNSREETIMDSWCRNLHCGCGFPRPLRFLGHVVWIHSQSWSEY